MTQLEKAKNKEITQEMKIVAKEENIKINKLVKGIADGKIIIPSNINHKKKNIVGIGKNLRTKINANIGNSLYNSSEEIELEKLNVCIKYKADCVMDLSTGNNIDGIRKEMLKNAPMPLGTVPIYQAVVEKQSITDLTERDFIEAIKKHIVDGADFITIHAGINKKSLKYSKKRLGGIVSRGGSIIALWMHHNKKENPLYECFEEILEIAYKYDCTLSLGDGLRPGCIKDSTDKAQISELKKLGELAKIAKNRNVQVMIEGPGHIPINQIKENIFLEKKYCDGAPFYVLGPIVTDIAPGYDHITSAIGGALAAYYGADFLCYVTPAEHLRLPSLEDVKEGIIAAKIAAHAADIAKGIKNSKEWDNKMSKARAMLDWPKMFELAIDSEKARKYKGEIKNNFEPCTMCGKYCAVKIYHECNNKK
ncbi:MAG: phosphomethylpyrimidine synthase ThiC [Candidatus Diapherotrites archaeon]|nr:phosphomethylpyrimidine synthase ThiC [Candidatus Diapherotrites archaeon]